MLQEIAATTEQEAHKVWSQTHTYLAMMELCFSFSLEFNKGKRLQIEMSYSIMSFNIYESLSLSQTRPNITAPVVSLPCDV